MWKSCCLVTCLMLLMTNAAKAQAPSSPRNITMLTHSRKAIEISWEPPASGNITQYRIKYSFSLDGQHHQSKEVLINDPNTRKKRLDQLYPYTSYFIQISAKSTVYGPSANATFRTAQGVPQEKPDNFTVTRVNSTSADIAWTPLPIYVWGGIPEKYTINIFHKLDVEKIDIPWNVTSYSLTGLKPNTSYNIYLSASSKMGSGDKYAILELITSLPGPSMPRNISIVKITDKSLEISWLEPVNVNNIESYYIFVFQNGQLYSKTIVNAFNNDTATITNLKPKTSYKLQMRGFNGEFGEMSNPLLFETQAIKIEDKSDRRIGIYIGIFVPLCIIGIFLIFYICYKRRSNRKGKMYADMSGENPKEPLVLKVQDYPRYGNTDKDTTSSGPNAPLVIENNLSEPPADSNPTPLVSIPNESKEPVSIPEDDPKKPSSTLVGGISENSNATNEAVSDKPKETTPVPSKESSNTPSKTIQDDSKESSTTDVGGTSENINAPDEAVSDEPKETTPVPSKESSNTPSKTIQDDSKEPSTTDVGGTSENINAPDEAVSDKPKETTPVPSKESSNTPSKTIQDDSKEPSTTDVGGTSENINAPDEAVSDEPKETTPVPSKESSNTPSKTIQEDSKEPSTTDVGGTSENSNEQDEAVSDKPKETTPVPSKDVENFENPNTLKATIPDDPKKPSTTDVGGISENSNASDKTVQDEPNKFPPVPSKDVENFENANTQKETIQDDSKESPTTDVGGISENSNAPNETVQDEPNKFAPVPSKDVENFENPSTPSDAISGDSKEPSLVLPEDVQSSDNTPTSGVAGTPEQSMSMQTEAV